MYSNSIFCQRCVSIESPDDDDANLSAEIQRSCIVIKCVWRLLDIIIKFFD
jgi:hypothetical protein